MYQYLLTPPKELAQAGTYGLPLVHLAFQIGPDGRLRHPDLPPECRGGLMLVGTDQAPQAGPAEQTAGAILNICQRREFRGVVLDLEGEPTPFLSRLLPRLDRGLEQAGRGFFLPEIWASFSQRAFLYLSSALSGGSLAKRLEEAARAYGPDRLVLALEPLSEEFPLPAPDGAGRPLDRTALDNLLDRLRPTVHFSPDLCAHYFTYLDRKPRLILFDRADSFWKKRELGQAVGIQRFFLLYPQVKEFLDEELT